MVAHQAVRAPSVRLDHLIGGGVHLRYQGVAVVKLISGLRADGFGHPPAEGVLGIARGSTSSPTGIPRHTVQRGQVPRGVVGTGRGSTSSPTGIPLHSAQLPPRIPGERLAVQRSQVAGGVEGVAHGSTSSPTGIPRQKKYIFRAK